MFEAIDASEVKFLGVARVGGMWHMRAYLPYPWVGTHRTLEGLLTDYNGFLQRQAEVVVVPTQEPLTLVTAPTEPVIEAPPPPDPVVEVVGADAAPELADAPLE